MPLGGGSTEGGTSARAPKRLPSVSFQQPELRAFVGLETSRSGRCSGSQVARLGGGYRHDNVKQEKGRAGARRQRTVSAETSGPRGAIRQAASTGLAAVSTNWQH